MPPGLNILPPWDIGGAAPSAAAALLAIVHGHDVDLEPARTPCGPPGNGPCLTAGRAAASGGVRGTVAPPTTIVHLFAGACWRGRRPAGVQGGPASGGAITLPALLCIYPCAGSNFTGSLVGNKRGCSQTKKGGACSIQGYQGRCCVTKLAPSIEMPGARLGHHNRSDYLTDCSWPLLTC